MHSNRDNNSRPSVKRPTEQCDMGSLELPPTIVRTNSATSESLANEGASANANGSGPSRTSVAGLSDVSPSELPTETPYSVTMARSPFKAIPTVNPPDSPLTGNTSEDLQVEKRELYVEDEHFNCGPLPKDECISLCDLLSQSGCQMILSVGDSQAAVCFRGTREINKIVAAYSSQAETLVKEQYGEPYTTHHTTNSSVLAATRKSVYEFFHARAGPDACLLAGWMRIAYALLFVSDRILWSIDLKFFFYSETGVMPTRMTRNYGYVNESTLPTIFELAPESDFLLWAVNYLGLLQGILLLLGIASRFQCACLVFILTSFEHQNDMAWDSQDVMLRFFAFLLFFLPLHRLTIFEWWHTRGMSKEEKEDLHKNDSWPMWPFRLWQIEICFIYLGAGFAKLSRKVWWRDGLAVYHSTFTNHFGGFFTPTFLFNNLFSLKLICWSSLLLECLSIFLVWPLSTRTPTLVAVVLLHVGIDFSMNMNIFEWLSILGWMPFLVKPRNMFQSIPTPSLHDVSDAVEVDEPLKHYSKPRRDKLRNVLVNMFITLFIVVYANETFPINYVRRMTPVPLKPAVRTLKKVIRRVDSICYPWLHRLGIHQQPWTMFAGVDKYNMYERFEASITFHDGTRTTWWSPDWLNMSWLERKRNRRKMLFYNNLEAFLDYEPVALGQKHLCEWIDKQHDKDVEKIKLVYHYAKYPKPSSDLGWFEPVRKPGVKVTTETKVHYIYYNETACDRWAEDGKCFTDPEFMEKRCKASCTDQDAFGEDSQDVKIRSRVRVHVQGEPKLFSGTVMAIRNETSADRFYIKWDEVMRFGAKYTWFDLDSSTFGFMRDDGGGEDQKINAESTPNSYDGNEL